MTTRDAAAALVTRMVDCFNTRRFEDAADLFAPSFISHPFGTSAEDGRQAWQILVAQFPEIHLDIDAILLDGDTVTVRSIVQGTGVLVAGVEPLLIETFRIEDNRLAEWWGSTWLPDLS